MPRSKRLPAHGVVLLPGTARAGRPRLWAYGFGAIALVADRTEAAVREAARRGDFDPGDLASVLDYVARARTRAGRIKGSWSRPVVVG